MRGKGRCRVNILRQSRRLCGSRTPQRGLIATQSQNHKLPAPLRKANIAKAKGILPELSNFCCLPGRAGGVPNGLVVQLLNVI
jgi:hypothetical protein